MANILVIAPHPDDEVIGVGGTILKHIEAKDDVCVGIVTKANPPEYTDEIIKKKREEALEVSKKLGVKKTFFLDFPTLHLDMVPIFDIGNRISDIIREIRPEIVYIPHRGDVNQDHKRVNEACTIATRPMKDNSIRKVFAYYISCSSGWASFNDSSAFVPNVFVDITKFIDKKIEIVKTYKTELKEYPHPRSLEALKTVANYWGNLVGFEAAEPFKLVREIQK